MDRLLVVRCPDLLDEDEDGATLRSFVEVVDAVEAYCPWVTTVRPGLCSLPARGPARYFGGEDALIRLIVGATSDITPVEVGVADGLFAAVLAAQRGLVVPPGGTPGFLAPLPVGILGNPGLAELLARLGIRSLGDFAALPESHVLGRFGADGVTCHRVAGGRSGELAELRQPLAGRRVDEQRRGGRPDGSRPDGSRPDGSRPDGAPRRATVVDEPGFWGGVSDTDVRAGRSLAAVQDLLGPDGVVTALIQGGRGPAQRARFVTWNARERQEDSTLGAPWPGQIPPPAPVVVHPTPLRAELVDARGEPVRVSGRCLLTTVPGRLSVEEAPWAEVTAWAGPWPSDERWWSRSRRRGARMQAVTGAEAYLLLVERGRWWVEATYG